MNQWVQPAHFVRDYRHNGDDDEAFDQAYAAALESGGSLIAIGDHFRLTRHHDLTALNVEAGPPYRLWLQSCYFEWKGGPDGAALSVYAFQGGHDD